MEDRPPLRWPRASWHTWNDCTATWEDQREGCYGVLLQTETSGCAFTVRFGSAGARLSVWWRPCEHCTDPICSGAPCVYADADE